MNAGNLAICFGYDPKFCLSITAKISVLDQLLWAQTAVPISPMLGGKFELLIPYCRTPIRSLMMIRSAEKY